MEYLLQAFEKVLKLFAALANDEKFENFVKRLKQVLHEVFKGDRAAFKKVFCNSFCAALANDKKSTTFLGRLKQVRDEVFEGDHGALVKAMCDPFCAALANRDEAHITVLKKILQDSREQQRGQLGSYWKPPPIEPRQPKTRRPPLRVQED